MWFLSNDLSNESSNDLSKKVSKVSIMLRTAALVSLSSFASGVVGAQELSYTFLEVSAGSIETNLGLIEAEAEADSVSVVGTFALSNQAYFVAGYTNADYDVGFERTALGAGLGLRHSLSYLSDVYAQIVLGSLEEESRRVGRKDDGYTAEAGIRTFVAQNLEVAAVLAQADYFDDVEVSYGFAVRAYVTEAASLGVRYAKGEEASSIDFGLRVDL